MAEFSRFSTRPRQTSESFVVVHEGGALHQDLGEEEVVAL
jgi:hypothetical protein